jgi:hypothetical protein
MISLGAKQLSLLDSVHHHNIDYWVVFRQIERERSWLWKFLKPGFYHVEVWGYVPPGAWIRFDTCVELISVEVYREADLHALHGPRAVRAHTAEILHRPGHMRFVGCGVPGCAASVLLSHTVSILQAVEKA